MTDRVTNTYEHALQAAYYSYRQQGYLRRYGANCLCTSYCACRDKPPACSSVRAVGMQSFHRTSERARGSGRFFQRCGES